ncbi:glycosyltransferase family 2 protein [Vibrio splendidus]|uniref:Rhamnosyltransferase n=1 Tax=Vibrio splendidus 12E03 TaxID=1191305 RepID=A0A1E5FUM7_VIBSP|nr:glycosyltransferase family 2 protein [Vibrio splendidus]OEF94084.1 rhamnosyltransferase [Vibrio splendidus 12E03]
MSKYKCHVAAIIVTYKPDMQSLARLVEVLSSQVSKIYVIDNASSMSTTLELLDVTLTLLANNTGIAYAQNIGLKTAIGDGFTDFVLFDQDSLPSEAMISDLLRARSQAFDDGIRVAAVGPVHIDLDTSEASTFISTKNGRLDKIMVPISYSASHTYAQCDFLIASGCLISKSVLDNIGYMEEELFIDCVDIEWGFRSKNKGYVCIAAFDAKMYHKVGDAPLKVLGQNLTTHSPLRHYYYYRNFYRLLQRAYIPVSWKAYTITRSSLQAVIFCIFLKPRVMQFRCIIKGIFHGLINRSGKYE